MSPISLNRVQFAGLHRKIVEACFPSQKEADEARQLTDTSFYGFNGDVDFSIYGKMLAKLGEHFNGRALYNYKNQYNKGYTSIAISRKHLRYYLDFLETSLDQLKLQTQEYQDNDLHFPPAQIRQNRFNQGAMIVEPTSTSSSGIKRNLEGLLKNHWWFYFYEYEGSNKEVTKIIRLLFFIQKKGNIYTLHLRNIGEPYTDFDGQVTHCDEDLLIGELKGRRKVFQLMLTIEKSGNRELYMGIYFKHDSLSKLYSGSVILHRIEQVDTPLIPSVFEIGRERIKSIPQPIIGFFQHKSYTFLKTPKKYSLIGLSKWLTSKKIKRKELKTYDLYVAGTILSGKEKQVWLNKIQSSIKKEIAAYIQTQFNCKPNEVSLDLLIGKINSIQQQDVSNQFPLEGAFSDYQTFDTEIQNCIRKLGEEIPEIDSRKIHYSFTELNKEVYRDRDPKVVLKEDFDILSQSKALIVFSPYNRVFSSCWVLVGVALALKIPIFIVYRHHQNLPFILRDASSRDKIHMKRLSTEDLKSIPNWFKHNKFGQRYFS